MQDNEEQNLRVKQLFTQLKGQGFIDSYESVVECREFSNSNTVDKFAISDNLNKFISIQATLYIKQWKVKNLKRDFVFKAMHNSYLPIRQLEYTKNQNQFYFSNSNFQVKYFQVNNGKIKQIWSMKNQRFYFIRQIFAKDDNFLFIAIPLYIHQYCKYTKKLLNKFEIDNSYHGYCFDYCFQDKLLVTQDHNCIKVWFLEQNYLITKQIEVKFIQNIALKHNKGQIYKLQQKYQEQFFMLMIYQISKDKKEIISINCTQIDNYIQYVCTVYSIENIYQVLQKYDLSQCQTFSIQQINGQLLKYFSQYKYLAIIQKQIYIRNKSSNNITNEFMSLK